MDIEKKMKELKVTKVRALEVSSSYSLSNLYERLQKYGKIDFFERQDPTHMLSVYYGDDGNLYFVDFMTLRSEMRSVTGAKSLIMEIMSKKIYVPTNIVTDAAKIIVEALDS